MTRHIRGCGGMADAADSKSADHKSCGFKSHQPHQDIKPPWLEIGEVFSILVEHGSV